MNTYPDSSILMNLPNGAHLSGVDPESRMDILRNMPMLGGQTANMGLLHQLPLPLPNQMYMQQMLMAQQLQYATAIQNLYQQQQQLQDQQQPQHHQQQQQKPSRKTSNASPIGPPVSMFGGWPSNPAAAAAAFAAAMNNTLPPQTFGAFPSPPAQYQDAIAAAEPTATNASESQNAAKKQRKQRAAPVKKLPVTPKQPTKRQINNKSPVPMSESPAQTIVEAAMTVDQKSGANADDIQSPTSTEEHFDADESIDEDIPAADATEDPPAKRGAFPRPDKNFHCTVCHRAFGYKHVLQNHERTHTGEKPFECKECHKRFTRDHHLKTHMRLHTGEKPYHCDHCDRHFVQVANLRRHMRVHTGEKPYKCEVCKLTFADSNQLKGHRATHAAPAEAPQAGSTPAPEPVVVVAAPPVITAFPSAESAPRTPRRSVATSSSSSSTVLPISLVNVIGSALASPPTSTDSAQSPSNGSMARSERSIDSSLMSDEDDTVMSAHDLAVVRVKREDQSEEFKLKQQAQEHTQHFQHQQFLLQQYHHQQHHQQHYKRQLQQHQQLMMQQHRSPDVKPAAPIQTEPEDLSMNSSRDSSPSPGMHVKQEDMDQSHAASGSDASDVEDDAEAMYMKQRAMHRGLLQLSEIMSGQ